MAGEVSKALVKLRADRAEWRRTDTAIVALLLSAHADNRFHFCDAHDVSKAATEERKFWRSISSEADALLRRVGKIMRFDPNNDAAWDLVERELDALADRLPE